MLGLGAGRRPLSSFLHRGQLRRYLEALAIPACALPSTMKPYRTAQP